MSFWDFFKFEKKNLPIEQEYGQLFDKILTHLPAHLTEKEQAIISGMAGLLARVAFVDLKIQCAEKKEMAKILSKYCDFTPQEVEMVVEIASDEMKELAGLENHLYCRPLVDFLNHEERYHILEGLFAFAASDGIACAKESEEIRSIAKSLQLENKHYLSARATVLDRLGALNS